MPGEIVKMKRGVKAGQPRVFKFYRWELFFINKENVIIHRLYSSSTEILKDPDFAWLRAKDNINYYANRRPVLQNGSNKRRVGYFQVKKIKVEIKNDSQKILQ